MMTPSLESGEILFFPKLAFAILSEERALLSPTLTNSNTKNISYDGQKVRGASAESTQLKSLLQRFSDYAYSLVDDVLPTYVPALQKARTSLRTVEIQGRVSSYRKDDTRLHVDAFPATPNQGRRILRVFSNINPDGVDRVWRVGEPFEKVAETFLPRIRSWNKRDACFAQCLNWFGVTKSLRTAYDYYMLHIHDNMKADLAYQKNASQTEMRFPPGSTWIVQTDHVSHAAMSGQHLLEQTFYLPVEAMQNPALSPLRVLEKLTGEKLA